MNARYRRISIVIFILLQGFLSQAQWSTASLNSGRKQMGAAAANGKAVFAGGIGAISQPPGIYDIYNATSGTWSSGSFTPPRNKLAGIACGSFLLFGGGANDWILSEYDQVNIYHTLQNTWSSANALSVARASLAAAAAGSKAAFAGGESGSSGVYFNTVDLFDTLTQSWSTAVLSMARSNLAGAGAGTKMLFAGGRNSTAVMNTVDVFDVVTNTWTTDTLSIARTGLCGVSHGNRVYFAGGVNASNQASNRVDIFDVTTGTWSIDSLSQARQHIAAAAVGNYIFFAGGTNASGSPVYNTVDILNTSTNTWSTSSMLTGRAEASAVGINDRLIVAGGTGSNGFPTSSVEIYTLNSTFITSVGTENKLIIYPNPSTGQVEVKLNNLMHAIVSAELYDCTGRVSYVPKSMQNGSSLVFDSSLYSNGLYTLQVNLSDGSIVNRKIVFE